MILYKKLAYIYAKSIFNIALKYNQINRIKKILLLMSYLVQHKKIKKIFSKYSDSKSLYKIFMFLLYDFNMTIYEKNFLKILIKNKRLFLLKKIYIEYNLILRKHNKIIYVIIKLSKRINDIQKNQIKLVLKKILLSKIKFNFVIDQNLIGGFVILIDNFLIDLSIKNTLTYLENFLQT
ncbi:ATP synthase F1 subunit delta [Buchnera aphidicola]|uniref:ATP synthase F1 subunit delta n=1 Tax=Buchnera aphidicola TaxID=9 RepID=UPI00223912A7|nr:ATP synthase F1 subunit delta [Buchnera aphidicola]MCW5197418.1 ATP synthase F1 subunit delta [Buchnera aphidicola (Chaitophorus viminalis)]